MFKSRMLMVAIHRKFSDSKGQFNVETLCSQDNRTKCLERMKQATKATTGKPKNKVAAAVMILLVNCDKPNDEPSILYTLRSNKLRKHIRQVSFPGGLLEENDASYIDCALRETDEEIGIDRDKITLWGEASLLNLRLSPTIMPVIGSISNYHHDQLNLNFDEVERVFTVPISGLCKQRHHTQFRSNHQSSDSGSGGANESAPTAYSIPVFTTSEERVWGITAVITHLFLQSLLPTNIYQKRIPFISKYR